MRRACDQMGYSKKSERRVVERRVEVPRLDLWGRCADKESQARSEGIIKAGAY